MKLAPACRRGHPIGSSPDRRATAFALVFVGTPFLLGVAGSVMIAEETLGPLVTLVIWIALIAIHIRVNAPTSWVEVLPVIGCLLVLQLLLDLHTPHLGDILVASVHAVGLVALAVGLIVGRIRRRPR
jgi:hypothetical protein